MDIKQVGRVVLRSPAGQFNDFTVPINIPGLQTDNDEFIYVRVESISGISVLAATIQNKPSHVNLLCPSIPQMYSYDTGCLASTGLTKTGACQVLACMPWHFQYVLAATNYYLYQPYQLPRVPLMVRANMLQGKSLRFCLEMSDGTPIPTSSMQAAECGTIVLAFYK
jgi:hypothetical protein